MTIETVFNEWIRLIDRGLLFQTLQKIPLNKPICPSVDNVFKAFQLCSLKNCKVVMLGLDPYPQKGIATGILFGNSSNTPEDKLSPSLKVVKEAAIDYTATHNLPIEFDNTLESWCKQGVLMLNSSLTTELNKTGVHTMIWRPFIANFIKSLSEYNNDIIFVLFGEQAQTFTPYIKSKYVLKEKHPAFYARTNTRMSSGIFKEINRLVKSQYNEVIEWYKEYNVLNN